MIFNPENSILPKLQGAKAQSAQRAFLHHPRGRGEG